MARIVEFSAKNTLRNVKPTFFTKRFHLFHILLLFNWFNFSKSTFNPLLTEEHLHSHQLDVALAIRKDLNSQLDVVEILCKN